MFINKEVYKRILLRPMIAVPLPSLTHIIRTDIVQHAAESILLMRKEIEGAVAKKLASSDKWTPYLLSETIVSFVAQVTARAFTSILHGSNLK